MAVSGVSALPTAQEPNLFEPVGKDTLERADFMKLFITQLQYQDPLEPMDSYEMASQLAQFSNMEATMKMSDNMEKLLEYQTSQNNLQLLSLIGKDVQAFGNQMAVVDGAVSATEFTLTDAAEICVVNIYDAAGHLVRSIDAGPLASGPHELAWDGKDSAENQAEEGVYYYEIDALNALGQEVEIDYRTSGRVTGLQYDSGQAILTVDNYISIYVGDVATVIDGNQSATAQQDVTTVDQEDVATVE